ncbi:uncharacterized protein G2W53_017605 [Senna tora]|uniref:Uncharacterized protein n=1 Tax=Senna tora TaxID=362788 RepID=A0A834TTE7_9FABA|nr:uncharacterized protein G2W53_017605 [Senna tora]
MEQETKRWEPQTKKDEHPFEEQNHPIKRKRTKDKYKKERMANHTVESFLTNKTVGQVPNQKTRMDAPTKNQITSYNK